MYNNFENENYSAYGAQNGYNDTPAAVEEPVINNLSGVAKIKVIGVGGAGNNAVNRLIESGLRSAEYIVVNTDNQALARSKSSNRIQIGAKLTKGLGAGADPAIGKSAAEESKDILQEALKDTDLLFITAGMGGGTGTGAAPIVAKLAKDMKILTVAVVTLPFTFEAKRRMDNALSGIEELKTHVDSIIIIPNDKIREVVPKGTPFPEALKVADEVLRQGIRGIAELIVNPALINLDFADVRTTLKGKGLAHMGIGVAKGEKRISDAVRCAVCSPLLNTTIEGASSVILNVVGGKDLSFDEVWMAADLVKGVIDYSANLIFGACIDENMSDEVEVVIIATGFPAAGQAITGVEDRAATARKVYALSEKIDRVYTSGVAQEAPVQPMPAQAYYPEQVQNYAPQPQAYQQPYQQPYAPQPQPVYPAQPVQEAAPFEPDDPIPDAEIAPTVEPDRKHRPKFVDFFIKKNGENK